MGLFSSILPSLITVGGSLLGGSIGRNTAPHQPSLEEQRQHEDLAFRQRVATLREHGMSPLLATSSASGQIAPPQAIGSPMGEAVADAGAALAQGVASYQTRKANEQAIQLQQAQALKESNARIAKDEAQAAYYHALSAKTGQTISSSPSPAVGTPHDLFDQVSVNPVDIPSRQSGAKNVMAGSQPGFKEYEVLPGVTLLYPGSDEGFHESAESLSPVYWLQMIRANVQRFGVDEAARRLNKVYGVPEYAVRFFMRDYEGENRTPTKSRIEAGKRFNQNRIR